MQALTRLLRPASASLPGRPGPQCGPKALPSYFCLFVCLFVFMPPATSPSQGSSVRPEAVGIVGFSFSPTGLEVNCRVVLLSGQSDPTVMLLLLSVYRLWVPGATILFWHGGYHCLGREKIWGSPRDHRAFHQGDTHPGDHFVLCLCWSWAQVWGSHPSWRACSKGTTPCWCCSCCRYLPLEVGGVCVWDGIHPRDEGKSSFSSAITSPRKTGFPNLSLPHCMPPLLEQIPKLLPT